MWRRGFFCLRFNRGRVARATLARFQARAVARPPAWLVRLRHFVASAGGGVEGVRVTIFSISSGALFTDGSDCRCASCNNTALKKGKKARSHFTLSAVVTTVWFASKGRAFFQSRLFIELTLPIQRANCSTTIRKLTQSHPVNHNESRRGRD